MFLQSTPLDLIETGKSLKVQAERPHLVSLGSGRLSTAITLLPLLEGEDLHVCMSVRGFECMIVCREEEWVLKSTGFIKMEIYLLLFTEY